MLVERLLRLALVGSAWVLYLLLGLSVVSAAAMVERWLFFRRHSDDVEALRKRLGARLHEGDLPGAERVLAASPSLEAHILHEALRNYIGALGSTDTSDIASNSQKNLAS